jgi:hypothetical protein
MTPSGSEPAIFRVVVQSRQPTAPPRGAIVEERLPKEVLQLRRLQGNGLLVFGDEEFVLQKSCLK